ncbi:hypothetical protein POSPLADRAFT_1053363 [Postia placenta MAD-698-R-SB12]|uniref:Uncharacterized protein n=1 Tax=Postia placenta MAD-698-R-SB12 TaxID=670580 RepID=A0A1X6NDM4_9APHY|nr:hypothetical protein POSPLADRAFT_1053363 [Postia placenta MAD-698-R-SB12]OSX66747.1 hypothetical protein POSPLADRAFT_1053363 [Postia placenta MAD-698-R-SB12]
MAGDTLACSETVSTGRSVVALCGACNGHTNVGRRRAQPHDVSVRIAARMHPSPRCAATLPTRRATRGSLACPPHAPLTSRRRTHTSPPVTLPRHRTPAVSVIAREHAE